MSSVAVTHKGNGVAKGGTAPAQRQQRKKAVSALLLQAFRITEADGKEWDQDELLDSLYWLRQLIAVLCGIIWGVMPLRGLYAFFGFLVVFFGTVIVWLNRQGIDVDEYGGTQVVHAEGVPPALGTFTLFWVVTHTTLHS